jgi:hypothetical protein
LEQIPYYASEGIQDKKETVIKFSETCYVDNNKQIIYDNGDYKVSFAAGGYSGLTRSGEKNIVVGTYDPDYDDNYCSGMLLHEMGHAYDQYSLVDGSNWLEITEEEVNAFLNAFAPEFDSVDWSSLDEDKKKAYAVENFANCFREYCRNPEKLKEACPKCYEAMNKHMMASKKQIDERDNTYLASTKENEELA